PAAKGQGRRGAVRVFFFALAAIVLAGCNCGGNNCTVGGDGGSTARALGEPCDEGIGCAAGMVCDSVETASGSGTRACATACPDAGCAAGATCMKGQCVPSCSVDSDCGGHFARVCRDGGAAAPVCLLLVCGRTGLPSCPAGF